MMKRIMQPISALQRALEKIGKQNLVSVTKMHMWTPILLQRMSALNMDTDNGSHQHMLLIKKVRMPLALPIPAELTAQI